MGGDNLGHRFNNSGAISADKGKYKGGVHAIVLLSRRERTQDCGLFKRIGHGESGNPVDLVRPARTNRLFLSA